jgi:hypothetical protein
LKIHLHHFSKIQVIKKSQNRKQDSRFLLLFFRVVDPYSFFPDPDPDPEFDVGDQYGSGSGSGSGSNTDPGL